MLAFLRVHHFAIIEHLELDLGPGLQIITGETGAGKSILIDALQLVLGGRGQSDLVRSGAEEAVVEALFDLTGHPHAREHVRTVLGRAEDELVVRRVVKASGRSRAFVNGRLTTAMQLAELTRPLVDICSQHEHHSLVDPTTHLNYLDAFADLGAARSDMAVVWRRYRGAVEALEALTTRLQARVDREAVLRFRLDELDAVDPKPDEEEELGREHAKLADAEGLARATKHAERVLRQGDNDVASQVSRVVAQLQPYQHVDPDLASMIEQLELTVDALDSIGRELGLYARSVHGDPARLAEVEARLGVLRGLVRKYGGTFDAMLQHRADAKAELAAFDHADEQFERLESERHAAADEALEHARALSDARHLASQQLGHAITQELRELGMGEARIDVDVARLAQRQGDPEVQGARLTDTGMDRAEFLISPHRGEPPRPLHRIASGGELSRSLLAIKRVLASRGPHGCYVFDEVDAGVGGGIAEVIGRKLFDVSVDHQVLCITHLPQIAAYADQHFHVTKTPSGERTASSIVVLDHHARREEIARMMGGIDVTDATRAAANELVSQAEAARASVHERHRSA